jgi:hypothetical protein
VKERTKRSVKNGTIEVLVFIAVIAAFFVAVGVLDLLRGGSCDRLDAERVSHLRPGHDIAGPDGIYIKGVGTERSEAREYYEAASMMRSAGC